jgi:uncharacterized protein (TIGR04255 family)
MTHQGQKLPSFDRPPLVETALGVQFDPLVNLHTPRIGLLWQRFRDQLPVVEQQPPLAPVIERLGARQTMQGAELQIFQRPPFPRCWFLDKAGTELLQVQQDRLVWNWRKSAENTPYPRYEDGVRPRFVEYLDSFLDFLTKESVGEFRPNQCEVTYVNHIVSGEGWVTHSELDKVFVGWSSSYRKNAPLELENIQFTCRHIIYDEAHKFLGRLHVNLEPVFELSGDKPMFLLTYTARGKPLSPDRDGVLGFLDIGRQRIVETFDVATTPEMHRIWRKN